MKSWDFNLPQTVLLLIAAALFCWSLYTSTVIADLVFKTYLMTASLFGIALYGQYDTLPPGTFWVWFVPVVLLHVAVLSGLIFFETISDVKLPARMTYGLIAGTVVIEGYIAFRYQEFLQQKYGTRSF